MSTAVVLVAAGRGERLAAGAPKALVPVGGRPLLAWALDAVLASGCADRVVVVAPPDPVGLAAVVALAGDVVPGALVVAGGDTRQASVAAGLAKLPDDVDVVLVHDAARALAPPELFTQVAAAVRVGRPAVVPAVPVTDTVRRVRGGVVDRTALRAVQTPQGFARDALVEAHAAGAGGAGGAPVTDDAGLVERCGLAVHLVPGHPEAFKVTTPLDLALAEAVVARRATRSAGSPP